MVLEKFCFFHSIVINEIEGQTKKNFLLQQNEKGFLPFKIRCRGIKMRIEKKMIFFPLGDLMLSLCPYAAFSI